MTDAQKIDYSELANSVDEAREAMQALVAGFIKDGFTDREAHALVAGMFAASIKEQP